MDEGRHEGPNRPSGRVGGGALGPGWYPDPSGQHTARWWNGTAWTEHVRDGAPPPAVAGGPARPAGNRRAPLLLGGGVLAVILMVTVAASLIGGGGGPLPGTCVDVDPFVAEAEDNYLALRDLGSITEVHCSTRHVYEVLGTVPAEEAERLGLRTESDARLHCRDRLFESYVGTVYERSMVGVNAMFLSPESEGENDDFICLLFDTDTEDPDGMSTGSVRGSGR